MEPIELREFLQWEPNYPEAILDNGLLYAGSKAILYGDPKAGKSPLLQKLSLCLSRGEPWLGFQTPKEGLSVFYMQLELPAPLFRRRVYGMTHGLWLTKKPLVLWTEHYLKLDLEQGYNRLCRYLDQRRPDVLIIDPLYKVISAVTKPDSVLPFIDNMDKLLDKYSGMTIVIAHHTRKPAAEEKGDKWGSDDMLGAGLFSAWADSIIKVERKPLVGSSSDAIKLTFDVVRYAEENIRPVSITLNELFGSNVEVHV